MAAATVMMVVGFLLTGSFLLFWLLFTLRSRIGFLLGFVARLPVSPAAIVALGRLYLVATHWPLIVVIFLVVEHRF